MKQSFRESALWIRADVKWRLTQDESKNRINRQNRHIPHNIYNLTEHEIWSTRIRLRQNPLFCGENNSAMAVKPGGHCAAPTRSFVGFPFSVWYFYASVCVCVCCVACMTMYVKGQAFNMVPKVQWECLKVFLLQMEPFKLYYRVLFFLVYCSNFIIIFSLCKWSKQMYQSCVCFSNYIRIKLHDRHKQKRISWIIGANKNARKSISHSFPLKFSWNQ